jgi:regulator of sigma E protease
MLAWLSPLIVLGLVVFVHELGHFLAAKAVGVYAPRFSLGWGPPLLRWRPKGTETEYVLSALPIGGYVRMASRDDETAAILEGGNETLKEGAAHDKHWDSEAMVPNGPKPVPQNRWFESKLTWQRVVILIAGVFMNVVLTLVVSTGIYLSTGRRYVPAVIDSVVAGKPAAAAGLQHGDSVLSINGAAVRTWSDVIGAISASPEKPLSMDVSRGGAKVTLTMTPEAQTVPGGPTGKPQRVGRVGVGPQNKEGHDPMSLSECVVAGWHVTWAMAGSVVGVLGGLFQGSVHVSALGGPIAIARESVRAAKGGLEQMFTLIAFLSVNLAVLNLLPIPILDGGQILMTVTEGVRGKPFSDRAREWFMRIGLGLIGLLFATVMFNDLKGLALSFMK